MLKYKAPHTRYKILVGNFKLNLIWFGLTMEYVFGTGKLYETIIGIYLKAGKVFTFYSQKYPQ